ncbi:MAG TPA: superoxide dismutase family protein [Croceicoccus sp.]|nr:superoxide dismutase family protein [Croceicoccus sp.]
MFTHSLTKALLLLAPIGLAGCVMTDADTPAIGLPVATAQLFDASGKVVGLATITGTDGDLKVRVAVEGLPAGVRGAHIHAVGTCTAPEFTSAGGHWNPTNANHGTMSAPPNPHAGDTGNITIGSAGTGLLTGTSNGTWAGLLDADGSAFVIHANPDDQTTQPTGNAGARITCGVFKSA